ncbi:hypothetical protein TIFTF001_048374 [Ficus carica]|uniref:Uncharacterized protein n=1 Tax=Ficus carica TaxID=3494 RepID=A0AA88CYI2_FICCA|nr:hypothetical protein TIFTF001_048374 [Ficus carica]
MANGNRMGYQFVMLGSISMITNGNRIGYRFTKYMANGNWMGYQFVMLGPVYMITNGNRIGYRFTMLRLQWNMNYDLLSCLDRMIDQERMIIYKTSKLSCVVPTCHEGRFIRFGPWFELDWIGCPNHSMLNGLVHGLSWIGLAAPTTPWLCPMVSNLPAMLDVRLWRNDTADCEIWVEHRHGFWKMCLYMITSMLSQ